MGQVDLTLYALVDADNCDAQRLPELARLAASNGATLIQYRDKNSSTRVMIEQARAIMAALDGLGVPLLVNDRIDIALAAATDGVHLGREDMTPQDARLLLGPDAIIGATVKAETDLATAACMEVDYACVGGVFATLSKHNPDAPVGLVGLRSLAAKLRSLKPGMPVGAIAGINAGNAAEVITAGADGIAVISAIFGAQDPALATRQLRAIVDGARATA